MAFGGKDVILGYRGDKLNEVNKVMKRDIDVLKDGNEVVALVVNRKKCYIGPDVSYDVMLQLQKRFKVTTVDNINVKLKQLTE